ncbi:conserved Plasmodium protein, unknown function [Plasmodium knowlesi strain H]|uniref:Uncharacterized protein n=3 Tax=Plasmodium knowlesi TaxID=5850 RepID=A0A5K1URU4_PLAKH|nr:conserved Plasmodium protein, unknown function [Plasmodium knowlesi strain H]OTN64546.1 Uncharacterized protein PKNOH_S130173800 [Plasmodium knowlesi]CAA9988906.1 conserved Plasmodium protein, unknown function [Plasmodium knowlesi strain H]SBO24751.1 conserved Plasmodium protein, unknown function [Plasmodium knowlesi strain H]SBO28015.1 conserved Plasmodium protein, unknown function [Plasmodium knowlesi strain H]VVS78380.1 conserved Plasmodium protein, unknown function [Plasmodium knowlesi |eukprot:XP_002261253.1 hypothetical protein, conserved in Plasmodium species [Plasmodium knowlesi strain H]
MRNENVLMQNCEMLGTVGNKLAEILKNLENILAHLDPLNNYEAKEDSIFSNLNDQQNEIIILSNVIYDNINKLTSMLHDFIKTIPPSYTYHTTFHANSFVIVRENRKEKKRQDARMPLDNAQKGVTSHGGTAPVDVEVTQQEYGIVQDTQSEIKKNKDTHSNDQRGKELTSYSPPSGHIKFMDRRKFKPLQLYKKKTVEELFYFSQTVDLEYANLLYMQRYEQELQKYLIKSR